MPDSSDAKNSIDQSTVEFAPFPREEFEARYQRIRNRMQEQGMEALLCTTEPNYRYLTGLHNQRWANTVRPRAVILPMKGDPVILQIGSEVWGNHEVTYIRDNRSIAGRRVRDGYEEQLAAAIGDTLRDLGIKKGRVGTERSWQMQAGLSVDAFAMLEKEVAPLTLVDAAELLWGVRMLKSPREIEYIRRAAAINNKTFRQLRKEIRVGISEREIERRARSLLHEYGAERTTYIPVDIHQGRWPPEKHKFFGYSTDRKLMNNGVVDMDCGCTLEGYWCDYNRTFGVGNPPDVGRRAYAALQKVVQAGIDAVKPGDPVKNVFNAMTKMMDKVGAQDRVGATIGGHGLGLSATERPLVSVFEDTIMYPGLFFTVEPITLVDGWGLTLAEEMIVVSETGCELLSERADPEMPIVG